MNTKNIVITFLILFFSSQYTIAQWEHMPNVLNSVDFFASNKDGSLIYYFEDHDVNPKLYQTHDSGITWKTKRYFFTNEDTRFTAMKIMDDGNLLMVNKTKVCLLDTTTLLMDTLYNLESDMVVPVPFHITNPEMVFINTDTGFILSHNVFRTTDKGKTWKRISTAYAQFHRYFHFIDNKNGFFLGYTEKDNFKLYSTSNGGVTWDTTGPNLRFAGWPMQFISADTGFLGGNDNCVYRTTDRGKSWQKHYCLNDGKPVAGVRELKFINNQIGWLIIDNRKLVFKTVDGGKTFFSQILPNPPLENFSKIHYIFGDLIFLSSGISLYRTHNQGGSPMLAIKEPEISKDKNILVYPNPASNTIKINITGAEEFDLEIYDLTGRKVLQTSNATPQENIDISKLSSGTYYVRVTCNHITENSVLVKE